MQPLTYRVDGDTLVFRPSAASPEERWRLRFEAADVMVLENGRTRMWLRRGERRAPR